LTVTNEGEEKAGFSIVLHRYARESMKYDIGGQGRRYDCHSIRPGEKITIPVTVTIPSFVPPGGSECGRLLLNWNNKYSKELTIRTARKRGHPYLLHKESGWQEVGEKIRNFSWAEELFRKEYYLPSLSWEIPEPSGDSTYVYPAYSQLSLRKCIAAWKLSGNKVLGEKAAQYLRGLCHKEKGYLTKWQSYFVFVESSGEYERGDYKEHRACSAGWVQEAEFFLEIAAAYDLLYETDFLREEDHRGLRDVLHHYMDFQDWLLTTGDGNNFQIAEAAAGFFCGLVLEEDDRVRRFLYGKGGLTELLSSVLSEDGLYFEMASGYMRLAAELLLEVCVAADNSNLSFGQLLVPASFDKSVILAPWANRKVWSGDGMPFLGMSFDRDRGGKEPVRSVKQYLNALLRCLTPEGNLFSCNDGNEQNLSLIFDKAYYVYREEGYLSAVNQERRDLLYGRGDYLCDRKLRTEPFLADGSGYAILRTGEGRGYVQAVMKYGAHGGYHGHFDRLSLLSVIKGNQTFYNTEYAWFGYDSFLFKMWVQTSLAHNMAVVDLKMQEPTPCRLVLYHNTKEYQAVCAETTARWSDPPYGGQTPYPVKFPEDKCRAEGRYILTPPEERRQGSVGEYTEGVFQRRMIILTQEYLLILDYLCAEQEHVYDVLYHPMGRLKVEPASPYKYRNRLSKDPYSAGQFITNCNWYRGEGTTSILCDYHQEATVNLMPYTEKTGLHLTASSAYEVVTGRFPDSKDTFKEEEIRNRREAMEENGRKTAAIRVRGKEAYFAGVLEVDDKELKVEALQLVDSQPVNSKEIRVTYCGGRCDRYLVENFNTKGEVSLSVIREVKENK
jgi:hypothetical protein